jgi:hypothetical protein
MVDQDEGTFTLWQANPSSGSTLVPVMSTKVQTACQACTIGDLNTNGTSGSADPSGKTGGGVPQSSTRLSAGAVAGIAVGVVATLGITGLALFLFLRSRRRKAVQQQNAMSAGGESDVVPQERHQQYASHHISHVDNSAIKDKPAHELHDT